LKLALCGFTLGLPQTRRDVCRPFLPSEIRHGILETPYLGLCDAVLLLTLDHYFLVRLNRNAKIPFASPVNLFVR
jgi:hypothetical protein